MQLVDSDVPIEVQRGNAPALTWYSGLKDQRVIPGLVLMELIQGARNSQEVRRAQKLVAPSQIVWPTDG